ncbi:MAG: hypothetical protein ACFFCS_21220 [Candidatus Hodarchaeota archaeon]
MVASTIVQNSKILSDAFGAGRYDPDSIPVNHLECYDIRSCITCCRVFAFKNGKRNKEYITCCSKCSDQFRNSWILRQARKKELEVIDL